MYISSIRVNNYKSFFSSPDINFIPGFNVIVGQNDAGKTALIESLSLQFSNQHHKSLITFPSTQSVPNTVSSVDISFQLNDEATILLTRMGIPNFYVPVGSESIDNAADRFVNSLKPSARLLCRYQVAGGFTSSFIEQYGEYNYPVNGTEFQVDAIAQTIQHAKNNNVNIQFQATYGYYLAFYLRSLIYTFKAERMHRAKSCVIYLP